MIIFNFKYFYFHQTSCHTCTEEWQLKRIIMILTIKFKYKLFRLLNLSYISLKIVLILKISALTIEHHFV